MGPVVIATSTWYKDAHEPRFGLAVRTIREVLRADYHIVVVDDSPENVRNSLRDSVATTVLKAEKRGMGPDRRQAFLEAATIAGKDGIVVWMEPEKHSFVDHIGEIVRHLRETSSDLVIPRRRSVASYPRAQQYNELFGNETFRLATGRSLDMWFGPQAFLPARVVHFYCGYKGEYGDKWDCLQIPAVRIIAGDYKVTECVVDYVHPQEQKGEDDPAMIERRLAQMNTLIPAVAKEAQLCRLP